MKYYVTVAIGVPACASAAEAELAVVDHLDEIGDFYVIAIDEAPEQLEFNFDQKEGQ